ncbi:MAG TPA: hypothetical protein VGK73_23110, partial [Polyangiaceae bacterium]
FSVDDGVYHVAGDTLSRLDDPLLEGGVGFFTGTGPDDIWAMAAGGIVHYDGEAWSRPAGLPLASNFREIHASGDGRLWLLGASSAEGVFVWDGAMTTSLVLGERVSRLFVATPTDVWAGGERMWRGNDVDGFAEVEGAPSGGLKLFGTGSDDLYNVYNDVMQHFDGESWEQYALLEEPGTYQYTGAATVRGEAFTGGNRGRIGRVTPDGITPELPELAPEELEDFTGVWSDGTRVYAVGPGLFELDASGETDAWRELPGAGENFYPQAIWGSSATDIWLAGTGSRVYHFDGEVVEEVDYGLEVSSMFADVHGSGPDDVWFVGTNGEALHFDGEQWQNEPTASVSDLDDVWVAPDGNAWTVGRNGVVMRYRPESGWEDVLEVTLSSLQWTAVTGTSSSDVWLGAWTNYAYHFDGTEWEAMDGADFPSGSIHKLVALAPDDVWGAGEFGSIVHYDGQSWERVPAKLDAHWNSLWMGEDGEGWAVGVGGAIVHRLPD